MEELLEILESLRKKHHFHVEGDTWYCCPACEDYSGNAEKKCNCGLYVNAGKVDKAIKISKEMLEQLKLLQECKENISEFIKRLDALEHLYFKLKGEEFPDTENGTITRGKSIIEQIQNIRGN